MDEKRFRWHPEAQVFGPGDGVTGPRPTSHSRIEDRPGAAALAAALWLADRGAPFRIGAPGLPPPDTSAATGSFETLTSGSSGQPRRISRSQASWCASFAVNAEAFGIGPGVRVAVPGRLVQSLALYGALEALHLGAALHLLDGLRPDRQAARLVSGGIDVLYASPAQLRLIADAAAHPAATLRQVVIGGSKLDPVTRARAAAAFPQARLTEFYGAAETSFITLATEDTPADSVGRAYPGVEIALRGPVGAGAIWVRSPYLFAGYPGDPGAALRDGDWVSVGDLGWLHDGWLFLAGRADRMLTIADQNVFPEAIEAFLLTLPGVTRAAVLAHTDPRRGHVIDAVVEGGDEADILRACRQTLGALKAPRRLHRIAAWPLLDSGKTDLGSLRGLLT